MRYSAAVIVVLLILPSAAVVLAQERAGDTTVQPASHTAAPLNAADRRMVQQLAARWGGRPAALAQVIQLSRGFSDSEAAATIDELAAAHVRAGDLNLAAEARTMLIERYPAEVSAHESLLWLVRLYASSEVTHARRKPTAGAVAMQQQLVPQVAEKLAAAPATIDSAAGAPPSEAKGDQQSMYALHLATQAMGRDAQLADNGALVFQRAVAARRAGQFKASQALLSPLRHRAASDPWGQSARAEQWLADGRSGAAPKAIAVCRRAEARPHLDGVFDDACWQPDTEAAPAATPAPVRWAYDREHLYFAIQYSMSPDAPRETAASPRPHDGDVELHDHVQLTIDVDRDYASWFQLLVDYRGCTADRCWGDAAWNPQWFVARGESADGSNWTLEAAIPLAELAAHPPISGNAWACSTRRTSPKRDGQTPGPSAEEDPTSFALLLFE